MCCRVVLSEAVNGCICFTRKIQHGGDWEWSRPHGPKYVHIFSMTVRPLSWACGHGTELLLILKNLFLNWLLPDIFRYDSTKKCPTILYAINLWLKPVTGCTPSSSARLATPEVSRHAAGKMSVNLPVGLYLLHEIFFLHHFILEMPYGRYQDKSQHCQQNNKMLSTTKHHPAPNRRLPRVHLAPHTHSCQCQSFSLNSLLVVDLSYSQVEFIA